MKQLPIIFKREFTSFFATPLAYVFLLIFLVLSSVFTFYMGGFYESGQANLNPFFNFHPWLYLFLVPALAMRMWAEERKSGTIELLMTLPITRFESVVGKFLAAWVFAGIALLLTFPMVLTVNYLVSGRVHVRFSKKPSDCVYYDRQFVLFICGQWFLFSA